MTKFRFHPALASLIALIIAVNPASARISGVPSIICSSKGYIAGSAAAAHLKGQLRQATIDDAQKIMMGAYIHINATEREKEESALETATALVDFAKTGPHIPKFESEYALDDSMENLLSLVLRLASGEHTDCVATVLGVNGWHLPKNLEFICYTKAFSVRMASHQRQIGTSKSETHAYIETLFNSEYASSGVNLAFSAPLVSGFDDKFILILGHETNAYNECVNEMLFT